MSPQTETKTSSGFKAGVKDYRLFWFDRLFKNFVDLFSNFMFLGIVIFFFEFSKLIVFKM
jgi:hypothetical protein